LPRLFSAYHVVQKIRGDVKPDVPFYVVDTFDHTLPFYLDRTVTMVGNKDELAQPIAREPRDSCPTLPPLRAPGNPIAMRSPCSARTTSPAFSRRTRSGTHRRERPAPRDREKAVNAASWAFIFTGVLLNASAQLLLKAAPTPSGISSSARRTSFPWA